MLVKQNKNLFAGSYDIVVSSGGMGQSHIPAGALWEMLRITRKGKHFLLLNHIDV